MVNAPIDRCVERAITRVRAHSPVHSIVERRIGVHGDVNLYTSARGVRACLEPSPVLLLTGIEAASGTNTDSMRSETPPEPYDDSAKAEQPRPTATVRKTHSSFDVEQNVLPKRRPERVEVGSVSALAGAPWTVRRGLVAKQGTLNGQGSTRRGRRRRRRGVGADASDVLGEEGAGAECGVGEGPGGAG